MKSIFKKRFVVGIIILSLGASFVPNISGNLLINTGKLNVNFNGTLDQESTQDDNKMATIIDGIMFAQSFVPSLKTLTKIELKLSMANFPDDYLHISIRNNLYGNDLVIIATYDIPLQKDWIEFDFNDVQVTPGNTYFIVCSSKTLPGWGVYVWYHSNYGTDPYPSGKAFGYGLDGHKYWEELNYDLCFKTYGIKAKVKNTQFMQFLENHPNLLSILQKFLNSLGQ